MSYIICQRPGNFLMLDKDLPIRKKEEALLKIKKIGICGTDLHAYEGRQAFLNYPRILGHELASTVVEIDPNAKNIKKGDNVIIIPYLSCDICVACKNEKANCCVNINVIGVHVDGGMQEYLCVPTKNLLPAESLTLEQISIVEPLAIGAHAIRRADVQDSGFQIVIGCGPIGLGLIGIAKIKGAKVIAIDINNERLLHAKNALGADYIVNADQNACQKIEEITKGELASCVFDATGNELSMELSVKYVSHGGTLVFVGLTKSAITFNHPEIHAKECTIKCSRNATIEDFEYVKDLLAKNLFSTDGYITHRCHFSEMITQFPSWLKAETKVIKAIVTL